MKSFPFIVCLVIGVWVGYFIAINKTAEPIIPEVSSPKASTMELMKSFEEENKMLRGRVVELEAQVAELQKRLMEIEGGVPGPQEIPSGEAGTP